MPDSKYIWLRQCAATGCPIRSKRPMAARTLYFVRHGQLDPEAFKCDQFTAGLTERGREQAQLTADRLRSIPATAIYSSTIGRAIETAKIIAGSFPEIEVRYTRLLWEIPSVAPGPDDEWRAIFDRALRRGERAFRMFVRPTDRDPQTAILVTHGNLIRYVVCRILGIRDTAAPESWSALGFSHCGITQVKVDADRMQLVYFNDSSHVPETLQRDSQGA
jgi:serine/threonine-protein phosphatase PGAM5